MAVAPPVAQSADLGTMAEAVTYYQGCESLKPSVTGEKVHPFPKLFPGKVGRAFLFERRWSLNHVVDPDLRGEPAGAWLEIGKPEWLKRGGQADAHCVEVCRENYIRQAVTKLRDGKLHCLSVYARRHQGGVLEISVKSGATRESLRSPSLGEDYQRFKLAFVTGSTAATVTLKGADANPIVVDAVQLEHGKSWPRTFIPKTGKPLGTEWVDIPAKPEVFNPMKATIAFWTKPEWLGEESIGGMAFFGAGTAEPYKSYRKKKNFVSVGAYRHPGKKGWENGVTISFRDDAATAKGFTPISFERTSLKPGDWIHLAFAWEVVPGRDSFCTAYQNGKQAGTLKFRLPEAIRSPDAVRMGYSGGAYADALMDEFYIFDRPLTEDEIAALYGLDKPLKP